MRVSVLNQTKKYVTVQVVTKIDKVIKVTIRTRSQVVDTIGYLEDNKDVEALLNACQGVIGEIDYKELKSFYLPSRARVATAQKNYKARQAWFDNNQKALDLETEKMVRHPGFMGNGVTRSEVNATISGEVQKLYSVKGKKK